MYDVCMNTVQTTAAQSTETITMTDAAQRNVEETNCDVQLDLWELRNGKTTPAKLLVDCYFGADDDRLQGWSEYVSTLTSLAGL